MSEMAGHELVMTDQFVRQLHEKLAAATTRVYIQVMTFDGDDSGLAVAEALIAAAERGVDVRLVVDCFAFRYISDTKVNHPEVAEEQAATHAMFDRMEAAGVATTYVNPFGTILQWGPVRNHKKLYVIDDSAYIGGINISDHNFEWLDFNVTVDEPVLVDALVADFLNTCAGERVSVDGPFVTNEFLEPAFAELVENATESIVIASPYALDWTLSERLAKAKAKKKVVVAAEHSNYRTFRVSDPFVRTKMEEAGVEIRAFTDFFHAKFAIFDGRKVFVGSANFGLHSFRCNQEIGLVIDDPKFAAQIEEILTRTVVVPTSTTAPRRALGAFVSLYVRLGTLFFGKVVSPYVPATTNR